MTDIITLCQTNKQVKHAIIQWFNDLITQQNELTELWEVDPIDLYIILSNLRRTIKSQ